MHRPVRLPTPRPTRALVARALLLVAPLALACTQKPAATTAPLTPPPKALAAANALKGELKAALEGAMQSAGPVGALTVCKDKAPAIAAAHSTGGVVVGRTSHKLRNPANAPRPWVQPLLDEMARAPDAQALAPRTVALAGGRVGYVEPILTAPVCTACHGDAIAPAVREQIAALYPRDAATGFQPGQLRGLVWVEAPAAAPQEP